MLVFEMLISFKPVKQIEDIIEFWRVPGRLADVLQSRSRSPTVCRPRSSLRPESSQTRSIIMVRYVVFVYI